MCFPFSLADLTKKKTLRQAGMTSPHLLCFLFFILFFSRLYWPKKKTLFLCINHFRGKFYARTGKMRKRSFFAQILTRYIPGHFPTQRKYITFYLSRNVTSCWHNEIHKLQSCSIFASRGNRCLQEI